MYMSPLADDLEVFSLGKLGRQVFSPYIIWAANYLLRCEVVLNGKYGLEMGRKEKNH